MGASGFPEVIILHFTTIALNGLSLNPWKNLNYVAQASRVKDQESSVYKKVKNIIK